jgi:hypothetical protein
MEGVFFAGGFVFGLAVALFCLDRYYKTYLRQIVDWIMKDVQNGGKK